MSLTREQCRAGRALLDWSQSELAKASKVATKTLADFERGHRTPYDRTLADVRIALEAAGVIFVEENGEGPGVRLKKAYPKPSGPATDAVKALDTAINDNRRSRRKGLKS